MAIRTRHTSWPSAVPLARSLGGFGARPALRTETGSISYEELDGRVAEAADRLGPVRRLVAMTAANEVEPLVWYLAALRAGHPVLVVDGVRRPGATSPVDAFDPDVVITATLDGRCAVQERRPGTAHHLHPDLALLLSTSGSTGSPRLVRLSAANLDTNASGIVAALDIGDDDVAVTSLPWSYSYGLSVVHTHLLVGASLLLTDRSVVDPGFWALARCEGVTTLPCVPHTFELLDRVDFEAMSLPHLRSVTCAGGRLPSATARRYASLGRRDGWDLHLMYGQTEATARIACLPPPLAHTDPSALGVPLRGGALTIEPVEGAGPDEGELVFTGPNVMLGYATSPADLATGPGDGVLRTGDLARRRPDGAFELTGRLSRFAKPFGLRIDLDRVEEHLARSGHDALCAGDDERLVVAVVGTDPHGAAAVVTELTGLPAGRLAVHPMPALPRLANGKPDHAAVLAIRCLPSDDGGGPVDVGALYASVLGRSHVGPGDTFVGLGGDSLSYVEASIGLEALLGRLPPGWHTTPVRLLQPVATAPPVRRRRTVELETGVVLRAAAIVAIVATHAGLVERRGGAHVLLAVAGFNLARFLLHAPDGGSPVPGLLRSLSRIAVPSVLWIGGLVLVTDRYSVATAFLLNGHLGDPTFDERWQFWFVEVAVQLLVLVTIAFSIPAVRRLERRNTFALPFVLTLVALVLRDEVVAALTPPHPRVVVQTTAWLFLLGWSAARADTTRRKALVSLVALLAVPGFFSGEPIRVALVTGGILLLAWTPTIRVPRPVVLVAGPLAGASLHIYLTHWQVYPLFRGSAPPVVGVLASLVVGVAVWSATRRLRLPQAMRRALAGSGWPSRWGWRTAPRSSAPATTRGPGLTM